MATGNGRRTENELKCPKSVYWNHKSLLSSIITRYYTNASLLYKLCSHEGPIIMHTYLPCTLHCHTGFFVSQTSWLLELWAIKPLFFLNFYVSCTNSMLFSANSPEDWKAQDASIHTQVLLQFNSASQIVSFSKIYIIFIWIIWNDICLWYRCHI